MSSPEIEPGFTTDCHIRLDGLPGELPSGITGQQKSNIVSWWQLEDGATNTVASAGQETDSPSVALEFRHTRSRGRSTRPQQNNSKLIAAVRIYDGEGGLPLDAPDHIDPEYGCRA